jgi:aldose sugar dehydrogenase
MEFDPLTGNLWDIENGPPSNDEINLVEPGFNGGWNKVQAVWENESGPNGPIMSNTQEGNTLVDFDGQGKYSDPEFTWAQAVGPTALKFSEIYGKEYEHDMFVGDFHNGNVYNFDSISAALDKNCWIKNKSKR